MIRRILFWTHFCLGVSAGIAIFIMSITGVLLAFERQILQYADRDLRTVGHPAEARPLGFNQMLAMVSASSNAMPTAITVRPGPSATVQFAFGRDRVAYADPYTGAVLGDSSKAVRKFFAVVERWHRALGEPMQTRGPLRSIAAAANLLFLIIAVSGCYLWLPRKWSWTNIRAAALFRGGLKGKARDWNWHNVAGLWCSIPLVLITLTGVIISYPWANALLFRMAGSTPTTRQGPPRGENRRSNAPPTADLDRVVEAASTKLTGWRTMSLNVPHGNETKIPVTLDAGAGGEVEKRMQLTVDADTGRVLKATQFTDNSLGQRLRSLARFTHTGEEAGFAGQLIAALASAGACLMVWTGFALAYRRLFRRRANS